MRLRDGASDVPAVVDAVRRIYREDPELELQAAAEISDKITDSLSALVTGLLLCSLCAGLTGAVMIGQTLTRHLAHEAADETTLIALGMSRNQRAAALWLAAVPVAIVGAVLAVVVAVLASGLMPVGLAREAEPDPGLAIDGPVLALGGVAIVLLVAALAVLAAWVVSGSSGFADVGASSRRRPSVVRRTFAQMGLPVPSIIGVDMALDPGSSWAGRARTGLAGVAFGVAGLVAATVFAASAATLVSSPAHYGFPWDAVASGFTGGLVEEHGEALTADPDIHDLGVLTTSLARIGPDDVNVHAFETLKGDPDPTLLAGRLPSRPGEVALGSQTLRVAGVDLGGTVEMSGPEGPIDLVVVGRAAFPVIDDRSSVERGAALTVDTLRLLTTPESINRDLVVTWAPGIAVEAANAALADQLETEVVGERTPADVENLHRIDALPRVMAAVLAAFAALTAAHSLVTSVRRRRHDLAVLRSLGFVRRQLTATVASQATAVAAASLLVGVPLGVVAGRVAWRSVARGIGVVDHPDTPGLALVVIAIAAVVIANVAAIAPARMARRIAPATILRAG